MNLKSEGQTQLSSLPTKFRGILFSLARRQPPAHLRFLLSRNRGGGSDYRSQDIGSSCSQQPVRDLVYHVHDNTSVVEMRESF